MLPFVYYALLSGAVGYSILTYRERGLLNVGTVIVLIIAAVAVFVIARYGGRSGDVAPEATVSGR
jgi:lactate permease